MSHVFFSYSRRDGEIAARVVKALREKGFVVWQDVSDIAGGESFVRAIEQGIASAAVFVLLWSKEAQESHWVRQEHEMARAVDKTIIPLSVVPLAEMPTLPVGLSANNAIPLKPDMNEGLRRLIQSLPSEIRRQPLGFVEGVALGQQQVEGMEPFTADGTDLVSVPLLRSSYCKAYLVGPPDAHVEDARIAQLCLQFSRKPGNTFLRQVYSSLQSETLDQPPLPFLALHITGPYDEMREEFRLDDYNSAHWIDAVDTTEKAAHILKEMNHSGQITLQVFSLATLPLTFALGMRFWRFWHIQLYNFAGGSYVRVMDIPPDHS